MLPDAGALGGVRVGGSPQTSLRDFSRTLPVHTGPESRLQNYTLAEEIRRAFLMTTVTEQWRVVYNYEDPSTLSGRSAAW